MSYKQELLTALEHYQKLINGMYLIRELLNKIESTYQQDTTTLPPRSLNRPYEKRADETTTDEKIHRVLWEINHECKQEIKKSIDSLSFYEVKAICPKLQEFLEEKALNKDLNELINIVYESDESDDKEVINARIQEHINEVS